MNSASLQARMNALEEAACLVANSTTVKRSFSYEISRNIWGLWWKTRRQLNELNSTTDGYDNPARFD